MIKLIKVRNILLTFIFCILFFPNIRVFAAPVKNDTDGIYTDDFANNTGVPSRSYVNVNTVSGVLQLTNTSSQTTFVTPYRTTGYAVTPVLKPLTIAQWGSLTITSTIPSGTTLKVQILSDYNTVWQNEIVPGNSTGIDVSSFPVIDISDVPVMGCAFDTVSGLDWGCDKTSSIKIKFLMTTTDTSVTPTVDNISLTWTVRQGDLTPTTVAQSPWPSTYGNQQATSYTQYYNSQTYPAFKWISNSHAGDPYYQGIFTFGNKVIGSVSNSFSRLFALDRDTGEELWKIQSQYLNTGPMVIGANGTLYAHDMLGDAAKGINIITGEIKWLYNWMGGHGSGIALANDGDLYYFREDASSVNGTLIRHNPDGTIQSQTVLTLVPEGLSGEQKSVSSINLSPDGNTGYITTIVTTNTSWPYRLTNKSRLFALDLNAGTILWNYVGNFLNMLVGADGTIYVASYRGYESGSTEKKLLAINPNGTLKWQRVVGPDTGRGYDYFSPLLLNDEDIILTMRHNEADNWSQVVVEFIDTTDGSLISSYTKLDSLDGILFADGASGYYHYGSKEIDSETELNSTNISYSDSSGNQKWSVEYPFIYQVGNIQTYYDLSTLAPDERGWTYGGFAKKVTNTDTYNSIPSECFTKTFALAPWTLTTQVDQSAYIPTEVITFTVKTAMKAVNPVFGGNNIVQIVMDNGNKIPLAYTSTDSQDNSVWVGEYTIPSTYSIGEHTYRVEAAQSYLKTDVGTTFATPPVESNNTGISKNATIQILSEPSIRITDIGLISNIPDRNSLTYFFTSTTPIIKGITQPNNTVYFKYGSTIYSSLADSNGNFTIKISNPSLLFGTNILEYYSKNIVNDLSNSKTLTLIVGTQFFPTSLLERLGLLTQTEEETVEEEVVPQDNTQPKVEEPEEEKTKDGIQTLQFLDTEGYPMVNALIKINGLEYFTDSNGEIQVYGLQEGKSYKVNVEYKGIKYETEVLGEVETEGSVKISITEDYISNGVEWKKKLLYGGIGLIFFIILLILFKRTKNKEEI